MLKMVRVNEIIKYYSRVLEGKENRVDNGIEVNQLIRYFLINRLGYDNRLIK